MCYLCFINLFSLLLLLLSLFLQVTSILLDMFTEYATNNTALAELISLHRKLLSSNEELLAAIKGISMYRLLSFYPSKQWGNNTVHAYGSCCVLCVLFDKSSNKSGSALLFWPFVESGKGSSKREDGVGGCDFGSDLGRGEVVWKRT
ncbi:hypothetical protein BT63DRAFT_444389, partial [Microthyrium microscopicum]